jgi:hypothetical protein
MLFVWHEFSKAELRKDDITKKLRGPLQAFAVP